MLYFIFLTQNFVHKCNYGYKAMPLEITVLIKILKSFYEWVLLQKSNLVWYKLLNEERG